MLASQGVPYRVVRLLMECGRLDVLRIEADKGDWNCGDALGEELLRRGETEGALAVYRSFLRGVRYMPWHCSSVGKAGRMRCSPCFSRT